MKTDRIGKKHIPLIIGNWKMNPASQEKALKLFAEIKKEVGSKNGSAQVFVAPPSLYLAQVGKMAAKSRIGLASQDVSTAEAGAYTGDISVAMLNDLSVSHVIIGHSERRAAGETDAQVAQKVERVLKGRQTAVVCIGEKARDSRGDYFGVVESQLRSLLKIVPLKAVSRLVLAYEPIWAIGTGMHATAEDVQEMKLFIQKALADTLGRSAVSKVRILYGGSVNKDNAEELLEVGRADGFLIGGSSLKAGEFGAIIKIADAYGK
jgi:triosephosphate isomerase (TIM)